MISLGEFTDLINDLEKHLRDIEALQQSCMNKGNGDLYDYLDKVANSIKKELAKAQKLRTKIMSDGGKGISLGLLCAIFFPF